MEMNCDRTAIVGVSVVDVASHRCSVTDTDHQRQHDTVTQYRGMTTHYVRCPYCNCSYIKLLSLLDCFFSLNKVCVSVPVLKDDEQIMLIYIVMVV